MAELNITNIPAPRVPFIDERTGLMAREWYRFFLNLFVLTGSGNNPITLEELQLGPPNQPDLAELLIQINQNIAPQYEDQSGDFLATLDTAQLMSMMSRFENAEAAIQGAYLQPVVQTGTIANYNLDGSPTAGGIAYGTGPALAVSAAGSSGQVLTSAGAGTPTWTTPTTGTVTAVSVVSANGLAGTSSGGATPALTLSTTVTGVVKGNGTALSAATAATDYVAPSAYASANGLTMATSRLLGRTTASIGAAEEISVAGGLTLSAGTLTGASGTVTSVAALTLGTTGTDLSSTVANGTTTPVITLQVPTASASNRGALSSTDWSTFNSKGSGSVTSVAQSFTGGLISVAGSPITTSGTLALTVAGTSGGIPYFSSASTWASSAALAAGSLVLGGGAGATPATTATGTGVVTALGVNTGTAGAFVVNGGALGTPSSGTVTNLTGTASININGTVGATTASTGAFTTVTATGTVSSSVAPSVLTESTAFLAKSASPIIRLQVTGGSEADASRYEIRAYNAAGAGNQMLQLRLVNDAESSVTTMALFNASGINATLGATTPAAASVTTLSATGLTTLTGSTQILGSGVPASGSGVEIRGGATPVLAAYNRTGSAFLPMLHDALTHTFAASGTNIAIVSSTGLAVTGTLTTTGTINLLTVGRGGGDVSTNTAVGASALAGANSGTARNVAVGQNALTANTTGSRNTAIGAYVMTQHTTGLSNVAVGNGSLDALVSGSYNTAVGTSALEANTASNNTAVGYQAGKGVTTASYVTAVGVNAAASNATGTQIDAFGNGALQSVTSANYCTAIGFQALNSVTSGSSNVGLGNNAGHYSASGGVATTTGTNNTFIGFSAIGSANNTTNEISVGYQAVGKGSNTAFIEGTSGAYNGANSVNWSTTSDERIKKNIIDVTNGLSVITALRPVEFNYKENDKHEVGFIAQEYQQVLPDQIIQHAASEAEKEWLDDDGKVFGIQQNLAPYLVKAIQEQQAIITALTIRIAALEAK